MQIRQKFLLVKQISGPITYGLSKTFCGHTRPFPYCASVSRTHTHSCVYTQRETREYLYVVCVFSLYCVCVSLKGGPSLLLPCAGRHLALGKKANGGGMRGPIQWNIREREKLSYKESCENKFWHDLLLGKDVFIKSSNCVF